MDLFSLIIGILMAIAVVLGIVAAMIGDRAQVQTVRDNPLYQEEVNERLRPIGTVVLAGQALAEEPAAAAVPAPVAAPLSGPQVFNQACNACHGTGVAGAPKMGDAAAWAPRLAKGIPTLKKHALEGFQGSQGVMPAKGGFVNLSDGEINAAVDYLLSTSR
jgi:cytochrome c5